MSPSIPQRLAERYFNPVTTNDTGQTRSKLLGALLLAAMCIILGLTLINGIRYLGAPTPSYAVFLLLDLATLIFLAGLTELNRRGHTAAASRLFLLLAIIAPTAFFPSKDLDRVFVAYTIPIILAAFLIRPRASIPFTLIAILCYLTAKWYAGALAQTDYIGILALGLIGVIAWLIATLMENFIARLSISEAHYRSVVDKVGEGISELDAQGRIVFVNHIAAQILGLPAAQLVGVQFRDFVVAEHQAILTEQRAHRRAGHSSTYEVDIARADGTRRSLHLTVVPQFNPAQQFTGSLSVIRDITAQQERERILRRYELLSEHARDMMLFIRADDGAILEANHAACQAHGYPRDELLTKHMSDLHLPGTPTSVAPQSQATHEGLFVATHVRRDGSPFPVEVSSRGVEIGGERVLLNIVRDITERQQVETAWRESETQFRLLFENVGEGIGRVNAPGEFLIANPALENIFGVAPGGLIGRNVAEFIPATQRAIHSDQVEHRHTGVRGSYELEITRADGTLRTVVITGTPWFDQAGNYAGAFGVFRDITEQTLREQEHQKLVALVETSPDLIGLASLDGHVQYLNRGGRALVGLGTADVTHMQISEFVPAGSPSFEKAMHQVQHTGFSQGEGELLNLQTGNQLPVYVQTFIIPHPQTHQPMALGTVMQDITARKHAEAEITRRANQLATLNDAALKIQQLLDPQEVYRVACQELQRFGAWASVFLLDEKGRMQHFHTALSDTLEPLYRAQFDQRLADPAFSFATLFPALQPLLAHANLLAPATVTHVLHETGLAHHPRVKWLMAQQAGAPIVIAPLTHGDQIIGMLTVMGHALAESDLPAVTLFARHISIALENARLFAADQARRDELGALYNLANSLVATDSLDEILGLVAEHAVASTHVTFARLALLENDHFVIRAAHPVRLLNVNLLAACELSTQQHAFCRRLLAQTEPVVLYANDRSLTPDDRAAFFLNLARSVSLIPLRAGDTPIGMLILGEERAPERETFTPEKHQLARAIGNQAAAAIRRATLHAQTLHDAIKLSNAYDATIEGWSRALDLRDNETEGHSERVATLTVQLARRFGFDETMLAHIRRGALLHDIGKMGIPDAILLKPGLLNDAEWEIMRRHPDYAKMLLEPIHYLAPALDIPYAHHEKWDGTGYPRGLQGEEIPLVARLFAVVDVWDALTSNRPYRARLPHARVLEHIRKHSGTHFDPQAVTTFLEIMANSPTENS